MSLHSLFPFATRNGNTRNRITMADCMKVPKPRPLPPLPIRSISKATKGAGSEISTSETPPPSSPPIPPSSSPPELPTLPLPIRFCVVCNSAATQSCAKCSHGVPYCSDECREYDEYCHADWCGLLFSPPPNDGGRYRRGVWFAPDHEYPKDIWLKLHDSGTEGGELNLDELRRYLSNGNADTTENDFGSIVVYQNTRRLRVLRHDIGILWMENCTNLPTNEAISRHIEYRKQTEWRGSILCVKMDMSDRDAPFKVLDLEPADYRDVIDLLEENSPDMKLPLDDFAVEIWKEPPGKKVKGQAIACHKEMVGSETSRRRAIWLSDTQIAVMQQSDGWQELTYGNMIGLPLKWFPLSSKLKPYHPRRSLCHSVDSPCDLLFAAGMLRWHGLNPRKNNYGVHEKDCVGEAVIFRTDERAFSRPQCEAVFNLAGHVAASFVAAWESAENDAEQNFMVNGGLLISTPDGYCNMFSKLQDMALEGGDEEWIDAEPY